MSIFSRIREVCGPPDSSHSPPTGPRSIVSRILEMSGQRDRPHEEECKDYGDRHYVRGVGYVIGFPSCRYNARSDKLRCAVNPIGPCAECSSFDLDFQYLKARNRATSRVAPH
jgi:hypothetical protein